MAGEGTPPEQTEEYWLERLGVPAEPIASPLPETSSVSRVEMPSAGVEEQEDERYWLQKMSVPTPQPGTIKLPRAQPKRLTPRQETLRSTLPEMERALGKAPTDAQFEEQIERARALGPAGERQVEQLERVRDQTFSLRGQSQELGDYAQKHGLRKEGKEYSKLATEGKPAEPHWAWSGAQIAARALDYVTQRPARVLTAPFLARPGEDSDKFVEDWQAWSDRLQEEAEKGNGPAQAITAIPDLLGNIFGKYVVGQAVVGVGVTMDWMAGQPTDWKLVDKTIADIQGETKDFFLLMETDWSTYFGGLGTGKTVIKGLSPTPLVGAHANVARATMRVARKSYNSGAKDPRMFKLLAATQKLVPFMDDPKIMNRAVKVFEEHGLSSREAARAFGRRGEFFGADLPSFLPNEIPILGGPSRYVTGKAAEGLDAVLAKVGHKASYVTDPYVVRKVAQVAYRALPKAAAKIGQSKLAGLNTPFAMFKGYEPVFDMFDPDRRFLKHIQRIAKAGSAIRETDIIQRLKRISHNAPEDASRRIEIVKEAFDPSVGKGAKKRYEAFMQTLTKSEKQYVDDLSKFFHEIYEESVEAGYLKKNQLAYNRVTGRYFPRLYSNDYGLLVELPDVLRSPWMNEFRLPTTAASRVSKTGLPIGELNDEFIKAAADPHMAIPTYAARIARGEAAVHLEDQILAHYGRAVTKEGRGIFGKMKVIEGPHGPVEVPAHLYNFLRGSFDSSYTSLSNFLKSRLGVHGRYTRAVTKSLDALAVVRNRWKKQMLIKRMAYHNLNIANDVTLMVLDGNFNAGKWALDAESMLSRGKMLSSRTLDSVRRLERNVDEIIGNYYPTPSQADTAARVAAVQAHGAGPAAKLPAGMTMSTQEAMYRRALKGSLEEKILYIAKREGLPVDVDLSLERLELVGGPMVGKRKLRRELQKTARKGRKARGEKLGAKAQAAHYGGEAGHGLMYALEHVVPMPGETLAKAWESSSKLGHFMWRLSLGDAPGRAVARTFDTLIDYTDPNHFVSLLRWVMPFATWVAKAPGVAARMTARQPRLVGAMSKAYDVYGRPEGRGETGPRGHVAERGQFTHLGKFGKRALGRATYDIPKRVQDAVRGAEVAGYTGDWIVDNFLRHYPVPLIGGTPAKLPSHIDAVMLGRDPIGEGWSAPAEVTGLRSYMEDGSLVPNKDFIAKSAMPMMKMLYEVVAQRDSLKGREYTGTTGMFPAGFVVPESDMPLFKQTLDVADEALRAMPGGRAGPRGLPVFSKHLLPFLIANPNAVPMFNSILFEHAGGMEAGATPLSIGGERPYVSDEENLYYGKKQIQNINRWLPFPIYLTMPGDPFLDIRGKLKAGKEAGREAIRTLEKDRHRY